MSGWTVVDGATNKSLPVHGTTSSGASAPYINAAPGAQDPVGKMRISSPQSMIDTDFEYGTQSTKWESIGLQNSRQSLYYIQQQPRVITSIAGDGSTPTITILMASTTGFSVGTPVYVQNANSPYANGWWYVTTVNAGVSIVAQIAAGTSVPASNQYNETATYVYLGYFYSGCGIQLTGTTAVTNSTTTVTVTTTNPHGLSAGSYIYMTGLTATTNPPNGAWVVATVPTANTFTYTVISSPTGTINNTAGITNLFARPSGYVEPRSFDGGVAFSAGAAVPNQQLLRQTRRYFRYQSGKGIQFSTGTSLCPAIFVSSITGSTNTATVTTRFAHNLAVGCTIVVSGCTQTAFNGTWTVATTPTPTTLTYTTGAVVSGTATGQIIKVSPTNWYGSTNRIGMFDQQNGLFFEYDGQTLFAVWRNSINQMAGTIAVTQGSAAVTGTNTQFSTQFTPGDFCVIRGQSYRIVTVASDTSMFLSPEYRGTTISGALISKTIDTKVPRSQWADPLDGSGPSGYVLDLTKMQMFYIDYSWYGAGFARWGLRTNKGQISYVYQQTNNNQRFEAYMRSGNMASHYESNGITPITTLTATLGTGGVGTAINVTDASKFAPSGTIKVQAGTQTGAIEYMTYTKVSNTQLTVVARAQTGGAGSAQTFTYSATAPISVEYAAPDTAASLSHWGSSVIMDGRFDDDKSLLFNAGMTAALTTTTSGQSTVLMAIRLAPAADNGQPGLLGAKEIINRAQLQLSELGLYTTGTGYFIQLFLNGYPSAAFGGGAASFTSPPAPTSSLAQIAFNTTLGTTIANGESVAAAYTNTTGSTTLDLSQVRDLGNSILGGGTSNTVPTSQAGFYPDGPDILYVVATALTATSSTIVARLTWKEAQA